MHLLRLNTTYTFQKDEWKVIYPIIKKTLCPMLGIKFPLIEESAYKAIFYDLDGLFLLKMSKDKGVRISFTKHPKFTNPLLEKSIVFMMADGFEYQEYPLKEAPSFDIKKMKYRDLPFLHDLPFLRDLPHSLRRTLFKNDD